MKPLAPSSARAVVVDDIELVRTGLAQLLRRLGASTLEGRGSDDLAGLDPARTDLVVLGAHLSSAPSAIVAELRRAGHRGRVVLLTKALPRPEFVALLGSGIDAVGAFSSSEEEVGRILRRTMRGERVFDGVALHPVEAVAAPDHGGVLSPRERQVLALLATRRTLAEVADELFVSTATVKSHTARLYAKLGVSSRHEAVERAFSTRILDSVV
jgi:DNA-binding NarL/FixJ family response regulator